MMYKRPSQWRRHSERQPAESRGASSQTSIAMAGRHDWELAVRSEELVHVINNFTRWTVWMHNKPGRDGKQLDGLFPDGGSQNSTSPTNQFSAELRSLSAGGQIQPG